MRVLGFLLFVAIIGIVAYVGCGPRGQVAMDEVTKRLDKALGELNVQRKKIENKQTELQRQLAELREKRVQGQVRLELLEKRKQQSESDLETLKGKIAQVNELVKEANDSESKSITRNDKEYTAANLLTAANDVAASFKSEKSKLDATVTSYKAMESSVNFLVKQEQEAVKLMSELTSKISEIDAKKIAVDAVRENTLIAAGNNKSISGNLEELSKEIDKLGIDVEAALRIETEKMSELSQSSNIADELLAAPADLDATQKMLEDLLK